MLRIAALGAALGLGCNPAGSDTPPPPPVPVIEDAGGEADGDETAPDAGSTDGPSYWPDLSCIEGKQYCGRCGEQPILCVAGVPTPGACMGEHGDCTPPATEESASKCAVRTCQVDCRWGSFILKPGNVCSTGSSRSCATNPATCHKPTGVQECVACKWTGCLCK